MLEYRIWATIYTVQSDAERLAGWKDNRVACNLFITIAWPFQLASRLLYYRVPRESISRCLEQSSLVSVLNMTYAHMPRLRRQRSGQ